jgi:hypothetical protein
VRRALLLAAAAATLAGTHPAGAAAVTVDVRVLVLQELSARVEYRPEQPAFVALYAAFSDGTMETVLPEPAGPSHWVASAEARTLTIPLSAGRTLVSVQAVGSTQWFDPEGLWVT